MAGTLTWLGHAAFRIETPGGKRVYVDPFLNGNPKCPEDEREPERADIVAVTHGHGDHVGDRCTERKGERKQARAHPGIASPPRRMVLHE